MPNHTCFKYHSIPQHHTAVQLDFNTISQFVSVVSFGTLFPEKDSSAIHDNLALVLGHSILPRAAALVRLPYDIVGNLVPVEAEHLWLQGESGEGEF